MYYRRWAVGVWRGVLVGAGVTAKRRAAWSWEKNRVANKRGGPVELDAWGARDDG